MGDHKLVPASELEIGNWVSHPNGLDLQVQHLTFYQDQRVIVRFSLEHADSVAADYKYVVEVSG